MAKRPHVSEFGNWESQEDDPHTVFFDKATENRSGSTKMVNPNDPGENPELFLDQVSPSCPKPEHEGHINKRRRQQEEIKIGEEDSGFPARGENHKRARGETINQSYESGYAENAMEKKKQQVLPQDRNLGLEEHRKSYRSRRGSAAGRTKRIPLIDAAAIPKFGDWDENSSVGANEFTQLFNKARSGYVTPTHSDDGASSPNLPKGCCFPWSGKR